jgi:hypothetical protein
MAVKGHIEAHMVLTKYAAMIYTVLCIMLWMRAYPSCVDLKWHSPIAQCHFTGPKKLSSPGPNPLPLAQVLDMHAVKIIGA